MLYACIVYILSQPIGLQMGLTPLTYILGAVLSLGVLWLFWVTGLRQKNALSPDSQLLNDQWPIKTLRKNNEASELGK
ncbi:hypothetical protein GCM10025857_60370 [Alicyclobacillus contaminans]|nr:hypothetical protein GCM10025857_60370 [Alicyclobacillus contaminans]